jgi:hypothetical protein
MELMNNKIRDILKPYTDLTLQFQLFIPQSEREAASATHQVSGIFFNTCEIFFVTTNSETLNLSA